MYHIEKNTVQETLIIPLGEREINLGYDLNDERWMDEIDPSHGAVFFASGVFYYFKTDAVRELFQKMAKRFPSATIVFDTCNKRGAKMMTKTWLKEAGISDVNAFFSIEDKAEIEAWCSDFASVTARSYMRGYRDIYNEVRILHKMMIRFCDSLVKMQIIKVAFR